ncbi:hypothetical protein [uncultured Winogradskyella sp.]|uniref:hypothetical protein n=1 Tax=uncultured Winogradskyella sp. TaxID=395353 RepID=UPI00260D7536|nr:hypothetical protein [uncultured Winogradskyella sp.]
MKKTQPYIFVAICITFVTMAFAQHKSYTIKNGIALQGGITQFNILTDNFDTRKNTGWLGGLSATVDIPHKWYTVSYNILFSENNIDISAAAAGNSKEEFVEYKMLTTQLSFLLHAKLIRNNVTLDIGPILQYNGDLELKDDSKEGLLISNYDTLLTEDITDITNFNVNGAIGLSAGFGSFKLRGQFIYGFTNILGNLNNEDLNVGNNNDAFKGNQSMLVFTAMFTL